MTPEEVADNLLRSWRERNFGLPFPNESAVRIMMTEAARQGAESVESKTVRLDEPFIDRVYGNLRNPATGYGEVKLTWIELEDALRDSVDNPLEKV